MIVLLCFLVLEGVSKIGNNFLTKKHSGRGVVGGSKLPSEVFTAVKHQIRALLNLSAGSDLNPCLLRGSE